MDRASGLGMLAVLVGLIAVPIAMYARFWRSWRSRRDRFLADRRPIDDATFAATLGVVGEDAALVVAIRRTIGVLCDLPPELIRPKDAPAALSALMFHSDGWAPNDFMMFLEEELDRSFRWVDLSTECLHLPAFVEEYHQWGRVRIQGPTDFATRAVQTARAIQSPEFDRLMGRAKPEPIDAREV